MPEWGLSELGRACMQAFARPPVAALWCSAERKAVAAAEILARRLGLRAQILHELGENDRSATGFLEPDVFEATADRFFAEPGRSIDGWEPAAQGHWFAFERASRRVLHGWRSLET